MAKRQMIDYSIFKDRILVLDGAMGTMIQRYGLDEEDFHRVTERTGMTAGGNFSHEQIPDDVRQACRSLLENRRELRGNNECLNVTHPEIIEEIHSGYILAGADIIETNTFSANRISQSEYSTGDLAYIMAREGARIARRAADKAMVRFNAPEGTMAGDVVPQHADTNTWTDAGQDCCRQGETVFSGVEKRRRILVAGSVGPTSKSLTLAPDISNPAERPYSFREMSEAYREQLQGLIDGGVDLILIETCFDALNTKAALYALSKTARNFPAIVSVSVNDKSGRILTGQTLEAFYTSVSHYPLLAFGLNCSLGAEDMLPLLKDVAGFSRFPVSCYPNAGLPNEMGGYDETPEQMAVAVRKMASDGLLNIIGGCCGTTPEHISAIREAVREMKPKEVGRTSRISMTGAVSCSTGTDAYCPEILSVSGLETVHIDLKNSNFTNIGERTNVAGSRKFAKLIAAGDYEQGLQIAAEQIENGASIIDINMDDAMLDSRLCMETFIRHIENDPAVAQAALMIDSSHWDTIIAGIENAQGKCIVNSISLKEGEKIFLDRAQEIHDLGAAMVVMAFDEKGQATTFQRKIEICSRAYSLLVNRLHIPPQDIIFDVNVLSVGTGIDEHARYGVDFIEAVRWIKANLPGVYTSGGISNLSFAFRGNNAVREAMHSIFLYHAVKAGLDMGIVNPGMLQVYDDIEPDLLKKAEDVILDRSHDATERLIEKAQEIMATKETEKASNSGTKAPDIVLCTAEERLKDALVRGRSCGIEADVMECLHKCGSAVKVIEGPLMEGMERVGELFGDGKMFLPQVVKSAKIMKEAVAILQPYMIGDGVPDTGRPVIVNATVKGDVHDIGKNITGIVLSCNGFKVIDIGVMVDKERILDEAVRHKAAIIGASGLITPSLYQMEELCREMTIRKMDTPLFIGGATTSAVHTAVKLAPLYGHVFYSRDASSAAVMAKKCMMDRAKFEAEEHAEQDRIRTLYESHRNSGGNADIKAAPAEAQVISPKNTAHRGIFPENSFIKAGDCQLNDLPAQELSIDDVMPYFDWRMFLAVWGIKYSDDLPDNPEVKQTLSEGRKVIERLRTRHEVTIQISVRILLAYSDKKNIKAYLRVSPGNMLAEADSIGGNAAIIFPMLRQEEPQSLADGRMECLSLCDFVPDEHPAGEPGIMGIFAISVRTCHGAECNCKPKGYRHPMLPDGASFTPAKNNDYDEMMDRAVRVTLAEAASGWLDNWLKDRMQYRDGNADATTESGREMKIIKPAAGYASCPDHTMKRDILALLPDGDKLGISLTESCAMIPDASICGFIFFHPDATYPEIRHISLAQYEDYARRRGMSLQEAGQFLGHLL